MSDIRREGVDPLPGGWGEPARESHLEGILPQEVGEFVCDEMPMTIREAAAMPPADRERLFHESVSTEDRLPPQLDEYIWSDEASTGEPDSGACCP